MIKGSVLRDSMISGANSIANQRSQIDELNVFPVPDGDTGTNMSMTVTAAKRELVKLPDDCTVEKVSSVAASSMLRGARGNSGVITSLLFRGFSKALVGKKEASAEDLAKAFESGVAAAYKAVMKPTEGTMLTVARMGAEAAAVAETEDTTEMFTIILDAAKVALANTPEQLPVLKKAGVVDAGGAGFVTILEGMLSVLRDGVMVEGEASEKTAEEKANFVPKGVYAAEIDPNMKNFYCTEFLVNKNDKASAVKLRAFLESIGDSVVVVDDEDIIKAHVHTNDPGKALSSAILHGFLSNMKIENMKEQNAERQTEGKGLEKQAEAEKNPNAGKFKYAAVDPDTAYGFVAVAAGDGLKDIFTDIGVNAVVSGGQTMNPSTEDILEAIHSVPAKTVFVLPNNKNIIMAAEMAVDIADRKVIVLPTRTIPQGISAMLSFDDAADAEANAVAMMQAADRVATGLVTFAARNSDFDGHKIKEGEILALENGKLSFTEKDLTKAAVKLARSMVKKDSSVDTVISGCDVNEEDAEKLTEQISAKMPSGVEVTRLNGGQPVYYYIISVE
ncbi:DAK2 domain-containing protein [Pygmaiobacter massiliensis]|uniref:DAK2 domain-containing protein n=1 Tax=Pygmaiobacter massiliensis TaxID=1917873 RepID=UPI002A8097C0|nr:DAK2 domain-containing protein [Pygmaiobacter massiliensis]MDY4784631.1 DAK2 domain-containing protein [Pygmaiobacter massiliensis]